MKKEQTHLHRIEPVIRIGKNGITENIIKDIKIHIKKRKLIKVKLLKSFIGEKNKKDIANELADKTDSKIIQQIGFVVVLSEKNTNKDNKKEY
jgi:RNA-binding protein